MTMGLKTMTTQAKNSPFSGSLGPAFSLDVKALTEEGEFEGYAAVFNNTDDGKDVIAPGAFRESLATRPVNKVKMLWQHDPARPIGTWLEIKEDDVGLRVRGRLLRSTKDGGEAYEFIKAGAIDGMSIGYRTVEDEVDREKGVRRIKRANLFEVSVVTMPMNALATIDAVKERRLPTKRELERYLVRDAGMTRSQVKDLLGRGYDAISVARDAGRGQQEGINLLQRLAETIRA